MKLKLVIPKGRMFEKISALLNDIGAGIELSARSYLPMVADGEIEAKIMKSQNIPKLLELGSHDAGFAGLDWILETGADVVEIMDLGFNPVKIVAAVPEKSLDSGLKKRRLVVASEYEQLSKKFLQKEGYDYVFLRTFGATEVFPPEDADMIIDNTATGRTLREHGLSVISTVLESTTRFIANRKAYEDPWKREKMERLKTLINSVLNARSRVMLEMNVPKDRFEEIVKILPCMRAPTVSPLYADEGFAVKVAVKSYETSRLIPLLKKLGATDILEYDIRKVVI
ncbi:MAG: ATP phosphoribosyltransferase [Candidatus Wallbacteria bacterium]|nr:ATP phosphoribosyltransferase [Candidatus Wallbacteria bacterium]